MILLTSTTHILEVLTTAAVSLDYVVDYTDITTSTFTPGSSAGNISTATTTTILAAPAASTQRQVKRIYLVNRSTTAEQTVTVKFDISGTERFLTPTVTLRPGNAYVYEDDSGWRRCNTACTAPTSFVDYASAQQRTVYDFRPGVGPEIAYANTQMALSLENSTATTPWGTFAAGTPGLGGRAITGGTSETGTLQIPNATTGHRIVGLDTGHCDGTQVQQYAIFLDMLWVNSGTTVTTTTAQNFTPVAAAARDINGTANGDGVLAGMWITTATTNAGTINNTTISYTNQAGTAGRTGTLLRANSTIAAGNIYFFSLQAGDRGVRQIDSVTLGTSYGGGALSFFLARPVIALVHSTGGTSDNLATPQHKPRYWSPGIYLPNNAAVVRATLANSTTGVRKATVLTLEEY